MSASSTRTSAPACSSSVTSTEPTYPAPPTTSTARSAKVTVAVLDSSAGLRPLCEGRAQRSHHPVDVGGAQGGMKRQGQLLPAEALGVWEVRGVEATAVVLELVDGRVVHARLDARVTHRGDHGRAVDAVG